MELLPSLVIVTIFLVAGLVATIFSLFGTLIIFLDGLIFALITDFKIITVPQLILLGVLYISGELLEYILAYFGSRKLGATRISALIAIIGAIIGAIVGSLLPGVGTFIGSFIGLFLGAFVMELFIKKDLLTSIKAGTGSVLGRISAIVAKLFIALIMCIIIITAII